jgi:sporulation protein YunB
LGSIVVLLCIDVYVRSIIRGYPMSVAAATVQNLMDSAMSEVLSDDSSPNMSQIDKVLYDENKNVMSIEVDTNSLNKIKTSFVGKFNGVVREKGEFFTVKIPVGTLMGNEYTLGRGPEIPFKLQFSSNCKTALDNSFEDAGINNTLHTVSLNVETDIYIVIPWDKAVKTVKTNFIIAQTLISGKVPEAYTNVFDSSGDITDDLFNFRAEAE